MQQSEAWITLAHPENELSEEPGHVIEAFLDVELADSWQVSLTILTQLFRNLI